MVAHWRDSAREPKFYFVEGKAAFPLLLFLLHIRLWTLIVAIVATIFFSILARYGFSVKWFLRWLRGILGGNYKTSSPWWK
jgi:intracellular multiplication protein IcmT